MLLAAFLLPALGGTLGRDRGPTVLGQPDAGQLIQELRFGPYTVRLWEEGEAANRYSLVVIERDGKLVFKRTGSQLHLDPLTGRDITGEGNPDVIIRGYSGGAHCCFYTIVCDLGEELRIYATPDSPEGNCPGEFVDLDGDGTYEFVTCDDSFAYRYCCYAGSPAVKAVLRLVPGKGFVPVSPEFSQLYEEDIRRHTEMAEAAREKGKGSGWDGTTKCEVLPLVLNLLYSGRIEEAWQALERYYRFPDMDTFRAEIWETVSNSLFFTLPRGTRIESSCKR
ncbi:hypothetical protein DRJ27_04645 [Candidatus Acetothermia bacterium]|nr:MAG: hypothetical protein DRJ27_04645 [Candidatus Acetothermia bacterium]